MSDSEPWPATYSDTPTCAAGRILVDVHGAGRHDNHDVFAGLRENGGEIFEMKLSSPGWSR